MARSSTIGVPSTSLRRRTRGTTHHVQPLVTRKLRKLKKIIPGCEEAGLEELLQRTAEYISFLELHVIILERISNLHGASGYGLS